MHNAQYAASEGTKIYPIKFAIWNIGLYEKL
jgi:hypothetical protein